MLAHPELRACRRDPKPTRLLGGRGAGRRAAAAARVAGAFPAPVPAAMRVARYAGQQGRGGAFVLAAGRLAFAGGFDLDEREILDRGGGGRGARGSATASARPVTCGATTRSGGRRAEATRRGRRPAAGAEGGATLFWGERQVADAAATARLHDGRGGSLS